MIIDRTHRHSPTEMQCDRKNETECVLFCGDVYSPINTITFSLYCRIHMCIIATRTRGKKSLNVISFAISPVSVLKICILNLSNRCKWTNIDEIIYAKSECSCAKQPNQIGIRRPRDTPSIHLHELHCCKRNRWFSLSS